MSASDPNPLRLVRGVYWNGAPEPVLYELGNPRPIRPVAPLNVLSGPASAPGAAPSATGAAAREQERHDGEPGS